MSIKPMDMQVMLPNIRKAAKPENIKEHKQENALQQGQIQEKKEQKVKRNKISELEKKADNDIKNDDKSHSENSKNNKKKKEENEDEKKLVPDRPSHFDMKV